MKIQKESGVSFKQRYAINSANLFEGQRKFDILKGFTSMWRGCARTYRSADGTKMLVVTGDADIAEFGRSYMAVGSNPNKLVSQALKQAMIFGQDQIQQLKALVDQRFDYKVRVRGNNSESGPRNLDILAYTLSQIDDKKVYTPVYLIGETKALHGHERLNDVLVAVKSFEELIKRREDIRSHRGITIGEVDTKDYRLISDALERAKSFGTEDALALINRAREILHLRPVTAEEYSTKEKFRITD